MFFILSKILQFFLMPLVWFFIIVIISFFIKRKDIKNKLRLFAFILLLFFSNPFIQDEFMRWWEIKAVKVSDIQQKYDYGIVLTGMISYDNTYERINFLRSSDRIFQAIDLYKQGIISNIFITGGSGMIFDQHNKESEILKKYLLRIGIPQENIIIETESRNTYENALETGKMLKPDGSKSYLLITSAFHLRRASACFKKQGFEFDVFATDRYAGNRKFQVNHLIVPKAETLLRWNILIKEMFGTIAYKIVGYC